MPGRLPKPPWETRSRVEAIVKQFDRAYIPNYGDRFRFTTLQSRYAAFIDLWDRGMRAREEGRSGTVCAEAAPTPIGQPERARGSRRARRGVPATRCSEIDKLQSLYDSLAEARREVGEEPVPFHRFAELVKNQVEKLKATDGSGGGVSGGGQGRQGELHRARR